MTTILITFIVSLVLSLVITPVAKKLGVHEFDDHIYLRNIGGHKILP